jgi:hypothetical protein
MKIDAGVPSVFPILLSSQVDRVNGKSVSWVQFVAADNNIGDYLIDLKHLSANEGIPANHDNIRPTIYVRQRAKNSTEPGMKITRGGLCTGLCELPSEGNDVGDLSGLTSLVYDILKSYFNVLNKLKLDAAIQVYISQSGKGQEEFLHEALAAQTGVRFVHYKQNFKVNHVLTTQELQAVLTGTSTEHVFNVIPICSNSPWSTEDGIRTLFRLLNTNKEKIVSRGILIVKDSSPITDPEITIVLRDFFILYGNLVIELQMSIDYLRYNRHVVNQKVQIFIMHYKDRLDAFFINESENAGPKHITELLKLRNNFIEAENTVSDIKSKYMSEALRGLTSNISL